MTAIAIDGPSGAGKSTISRIVAEELGFVYVDTGALYRAIGLFAVEQGTDVTDGDALVPKLRDIRVELVYREGKQRILMNDRDVSEEIRRPDMSMAASDVSAIPGVRDFLLSLQREMAQRYNVVMDGRDIGTVVLPDADVKIFLTATPEDRARRRWEEYASRGEQIGYDEVLRDMIRRDHNDSNRTVAPLRRADSAVLADTTGYTLEMSVALVLQIIRECGIE